MINRNKIIKYLDKLKDKDPEQIIIMETPNGSVECTLEDAYFYEGANGEIVIDAE